MNTFAELFGGGIWVASAIAVAGYSWQAFTGQYKKFPGLSGGVGSSDQTQLQNAAAQASPGAESTLRKLGIGSNNPFFKAVRTVAGLTGVAGGPVKSATVTPPHLPELYAAVRAKDRTTALYYWNSSVRALNKVPAIGGHGDVGMSLELRKAGLLRQFQQLTGIHTEGF